LTGLGPLLYTGGVPGELTRLLSRARDGDTEAVGALFTATYSELHKLAHARLRSGGRDAVLDTTALVHESYVRFAELGRLDVSDRVQFFRYASQAMRSIIVDFVRKRQADRRGGLARQVSLTTGIASTGGGEVEILHVHEGLEKLEKVDPRMAKVVEMRYFGGMSDGEIAEALDVTDRTVRRDWEKARLLLANSLR
jgi:RNA polymerase sigma factor (TIGR02999 family)